MNRTAHSYGCLMAMIPEPLAEEIRSFGRQIPDRRIYSDGADIPGREDHIHCTVKYGIDPNVFTDEVLALCSGMEPIKAVLGGVNVFIADDFIVLKIRLQGESLKELNRKVSSHFRCRDRFTLFQPHVTIAYLKKDDLNPEWYREFCGDKFEGRKLVIEKLVYSVRGEKTEVILNSRIARIASKIERKESRIAKIAAKIAIECREGQSFCSPRQAKPLVKAISRSETIASDITADLAERLNYEAGFKQGNADRKIGVTSTVSSHSHLIGFKEGYRDGLTGKYNPPIEIRAAARKWESPTPDRKSWRREIEPGKYEYRDSPPPQDEGKAEQETTKEKSPAKEDEKEKDKPKTEKKVWKHHVVLDKKALVKTLSEGHFSIISAGRNDRDPLEEKLSPDDEIFHKRHEMLKDELEKAGIPFTEAAGCYGAGREPSFFVFHDDTELSPKTVKSVMLHHSDAKELNERKKILDKLGEVFNQNSVLHGEAGKYSLSFTTGERKGKICSGEGWKEIENPRDDQFYTDMSLVDKDHTKFELDLAECKKLGWI